MGKKTLIVIIVALLLIAVAVTLFLVLRKAEDNLDYTNLTHSLTKTAIKVGVPKERGFSVRQVGSLGNMIEYLNEEGGYSITARLFTASMDSYERDKDLAKAEVGYEEIKVNKFDGYQFNGTSYSKVITLALGETENEEGLYKIIEIDISRTRDYDKKIDEIIESDDVQAFLKSIQTTEYVEKEVVNEEVEENFDEVVDEELNDVVNEEVEEDLEETIE